MLVIKSLLILCSAAVVLASSSRAVVSGAIFVGEDKTDDSFEPIDIFKHPHNHVTAVSSILTFSAKQADFYPATKSAKSLGSTLNRFIEKASSFPGFVLVRSKETSLDLDGSFPQFEQAVRESGPNYRHQALLARNLRDLIPGYIVNEDVDDWVLSLIVVDKPEERDTVKIGLISVTLSIETDKGNTAYIPKQQARLNSAVYEVNKSFLVSYADNLAEKIPIVRVRDALDFFASPKVENDDSEIIAPTSCNKKSVMFVNQAQRALYNWQNL